jgi:spermidine synthase
MDGIAGAEGLIDRAEMIGGRELQLSLRRGVYTIRVDGLELMSSRAGLSERALAERGLEHCRERAGARVLVAGLGMGFTLRATLDRLPASAMVVVVELCPAVVGWCRGALAHLGADALADPRTAVVVADVHDVLREGAWDAILLDVDNGPEAVSRSENRRLYGPAGARVLWHALRPNGVVAVWSSGQGGAFPGRLAEAGFEVRVDEVAPGAGVEAFSHSLILGRRGSGVEGETGR